MDQLLKHGFRLLVVRGGLCLQDTSQFEIGDDTTHCFLCYLYFFFMNICN